MIKRETYFVDQRYLFEGRQVIRVFPFMNTLSFPALCNKDQEDSDVN